MYGIYIYIHTPWMCVKRCLVCSHVYRHASVLMKASCVDAEWQPERCESWGEQTSRARMTVWLRRSEASWKWGDLAIWAMWLYDGAISHVCRLEDKPKGKRRGYWGKRKRGLLCTMRCVCLSVCVRGCQRYSPQQRDQKAYEKKQKCLALEWLRWRGERLSNLLVGSRDAPGPNLQFWTASLGLGR